MKQAMTSQEAIDIFEAMEPRLKQLWEKLTSGNYNAATQYAFTIGFINDIDGVLKKMKIKRTPTEQEGVEEIEMSDIEPLLKQLDEMEDE